jgi:hypothetical protein
MAAVTKYNKNFYNRCQCFYLAQVHLSNGMEEKNFLSVSSELRVSLEQLHWVKVLSVPL